MEHQKKNSVLIVDDETSNVIALSHILQPEYTVYVAKSGATAIEAAVKHQPDVILLDVIMPEIDGYTVIAALKNSEVTRNIPVIFITGLSDAADEERGLALGAVDYLAKPFSPALVKLRVSNQIKLIEQFRSNKYDIMKYKLSNDALNIALWDMDVISDDPVNIDNRLMFTDDFRKMLGFVDENDFPNKLKSWSNRIHPDDHEKVLKAFEAHLNDYSGKTLYDVEKRLKMKSGEYRYFRALGTTNRNNAGVPIRTAGALMDITAQKEMQQELSETMSKIKENAHWYKSILDAIPLPVTVTDADMNWTFVNRATEDFLDTKLEHIVGKPCSNWNSEICNTDKCGIACAKRGVKRTFFNHEDSSYQVDVEIFYNIEGEIAGFIEIVQDITNIRQLAKERAEIEVTSKAKSAFLANMSHEIRTPMNAIWGITEILIQDGNVSEKTKEGLAKIYNSCDLLLGIINDILDFSKIEAGKLDILPAEYNILSLINDSINLNIMRIGDKSIKFDVRIDEDIPLNLIGDQLRIKQIMNNLLSNAFKYTDEGTVTLIVNSEPDENDCDKIILDISVVDTGYGMTNEQVEKLFDEYSRFYQDSGKTIEGTGLGLSITQRLIKLMGGDIAVESAPGEGTMFTVRLPHIKASDEVIGKESAQNLQQLRERNMNGANISKVIQHPMPYGKVLVVDDVETNLYVAEGLMKPYRLQIDTVQSGLAAIERIKSGREYDIIFMDHMMPEPDGIKTTKQIRELGYTRPIVALTANALSGQSEMFLQSGFDEFISKPIDIRRLNAVLIKHIRDKQPPEILEAVRAQFFKKEKDINQELVEAFLRDARRTTGILEGICAKVEEGDYSSEEELQKFIVAIHGIKGACANMGETALSEMAYSFEQAGKKKDLSLLTSSAPDLLENLHSVIEKHTPKTDAHTHSDQNIDVNELIESLSVTIQMCKDYNRKGALDSIAGIKLSTDVLDQIRTQVLHSEFENAVNTAVQYIEKLSKEPLELISKSPEFLKKSTMQILSGGIDGMDVEKGLKRYDMNADVYLKILHSFAINARSMLKTMEIVSKSEQYIITVHGFKGMSFDIFANEIGEKAKELEFAGKDANWEFVTANNQSFINSAYALVDRIDAVLGEISALNPKPIKEKPEIKLLEKLCAACKIYDMDGVDSAMSEIEAFKYSADDGLCEWLRNMVDVMDYPKIVKKLS